MGDIMKYICSLIGLLWLCTPFQILASNPTFTWHQTQVEIPLGESLEPYLLIPYATLSAPYDDPNIYYERNGVNFTYQSIIQTRYAKTYRLDYRVYSPKFKIQSVQTITFKVVDSIPPTVTKIPTLEVPVFTKEVDYLRGLLYEDNYSSKEKIKITVDSNAVNLNQIGIYRIRYVLSDEFGNETVINSTVQVKDYYAPSITQTKPLKIEPNTPWEPNDYFLIKDNYDAYPVVHVNDQTVDYTKEGAYTITISALDMSGNGNVLSIELEIKDETPPEIALKTSELTLNQYQVFDLKSIILKVTDNYSIVFIEDVLIETDLDLDRVGAYEALYTLKDQSGHQTIQKVSIYVVNKTEPKLEFKSLIIEKGIPYNLYEGLVYDSSLTVRVFDSNIQMEKGFYQVVYVVIDPYGNHATYIREVEVMGDESTLNPRIMLIGFIGVLGIGYGIWFLKKRRP